MKVSRRLRPVSGGERKFYSVDIRNIYIVTSIEDGPSKNRYIDRFVGDRQYLK